MKLTDIDKNFLAGAFEDRDYCFRPAPWGGMRLEGFAFHSENGGAFYRGLLSEADRLPPGVRELCHHTSGGVLRFRTSATRVAIKARLSHFYEMIHMPITGASAFSCYANGVFMGGLMPTLERKGVIAAECEIPGGEISIYFPLYSGVESLEVGLPAGADAEAPAPHVIEKPIVFYGSSITQGGCAASPGNNYTALLGRWLGAPVLNFGFSGSAKGEPYMVELLSRLEMSMFVLDYDYNAPTAAHLRETHRPFFDQIRLHHPNIPILMMTMPSPTFNEISERREIIRATYEGARAGGDANVYFIDGAELWGEEDREECSMDRCHPNTLGFMRMARRVHREITDNSIFG